ncbi:preprotein translocase subunit Sec61beta [Candidatus Micrarchaeota archaeon]|nr:preprotein translocase subunit Sec61beta [Candidatus Micrarchaeota archaeon]
MANDRVSMPLSGAGIIGFSSDMKLSGIQVDPKTLLIGVAIFVIAVKVASVAIGTF